MYVNVDQCMINVWLMVFVSDDADYWLWNTTGLTDIQPIFLGGIGWRIFNGFQVVPLR
jgi:hypothetical protein